MKKFLFILILLIFHRVYSETDKKYALLYFKFYPTDLKVKVFIDNRFNLTDAEKAEYHIANIKNGEAKIFLVNSSKLERLDKTINYQYRIAFYKTDGKNEIPVYSFKLYFEGDKVKIKYDNMNEKEFIKDLISDSYFIKDINGNDFNLSEKMRKVKLIGKIKEVTPDGKVNYKVLSDKVKITLLRKVEDDNFAKDREIEVELGKEFFIGHYPYELIFDETEKFIPLALLIKNNEESKDFLIHFGEVWDNPYEYTLIFERNKNVIEILKDDNFEYYYKIGKKKFKKVDNIRFFTKNYTNENIKIRIAGKSNIIKWLKTPFYNFSFTLSYDKNAKELVENLCLSNSFLKKLDDWTISFIPEFKSTPFAIFCYPDNANLEIDKLDPLFINEESKMSFNSTPVFLNELSYGKYRITVKWFNEDKSHSESEVKIINIDDNIFLGREIRFFTNKTTKIPYIFLEKSGVNIKERENYLKNIDLPYSTNYAYYIQLIAFDSKDKNIEKKIKNFVINYRKKYEVLYNENSTLYLAHKSINGKQYTVILNGPYDKKAIEKEINKNQRIVTSSFLVKNNELKNLRELSGSN
ncbi:MAG: hypothetical protein N2258_03355 [Brevinematales bacterium]|nr:hypothetical protein [Brevinematales bacterium]